MKNNPAPPLTRHRWVAHGSQWAEFEDLLIGDRDGLLALRKAIDDALECGKGDLSDSDSEFIAVQMVDRHPDLDRNPQSLRSRLAKFGLLCAVVFMVICLVYGCVRLPDLFK